MTQRFAEVITTESQLRAVLGTPAPRALRKEISRLDAHCRAIIANSPFVLIASSDASGAVDVSPKGDPPGFVRVVDEHTLAVPDRPGNRRADTFSNLLQNSGVGLLFLVPGKAESLRVNGRAVIVRDRLLRESMAVSGKVPQLAIVVTVEQAYVHCGKCMARSRLWEPGFWPDVSGLPSHARCLVDHANLSENVEQLEASIRKNHESGLY
jgi:PPOX class probable FMN-dependent enzyme